jgi:hypothetical protein
MPASIMTRREQFHIGNKLQMERTSLANGQVPEANTRASEGHLKNLPQGSTHLTRCQKPDAEAKKMASESA